MQHFTLQLNDWLGEYQSPQNPTLTAYIANVSDEIDPDIQRGCVLICPGGGYEFVCEREGEPVALQYMARGYNAFVLRYSVMPCRYPQQLMEVLLSIALIRNHAQEWHCRKDAIAVCGFSAGGHLACSAGCLYDDEKVLSMLNMRPEQVRPNGMILCYPVVSSGACAHKDSFQAVTGGRKDLMNKLSLENRVTINTPPAFIWHTADDHFVPVQNSLYLAQSMAAAGIPFALHIYPHGTHGLSLCNELTGSAKRNPWILNPDCETWFDLSVNWLKLLCTGAFRF